MTVLHNSISAYWDQRAASYSREIAAELHSDQRGTLAFLRYLLSTFAPHLALKDDSALGQGQAQVQGHALDLGCGPGLFSVFLASHGFSVTALDGSEGMLAQARLNCEHFLSAEQQERVTLVSGDVAHPPVAEGSCDLIVARDVWWNLPQPQVAYAHALKALKSQGLLIIFDGNYYYSYQNSAYYQDYTKTHQNLDGVNVAEMERIAQTLPLSYQLRPAYDLKVISDLAGDSVSAHAWVELKAPDDSAAASTATNTVVPATSSADVVLGSHRWRPFTPDNSIALPEIIDKFVVCVQKH